MMYNDYISIYNKLPNHPNLDRKFVPHGVPTHLRNHLHDLASELIGVLPAARCQRSGCVGGTGDLKKLVQWRVAIPKLY